MLDSDLSDRLVLLGIGVLVIMAPVFIIMLTIAFLVISGDLLLSDLTLLEFLELYIIELLLVAVFAYGLYRLTIVMVGQQLPSSLDAVELDEQEDQTGDNTHDELD